MTKLTFKESQRISREFLETRVGKLLKSTQTQIYDWCNGALECPVPAAQMIADLSDGKLRVVVTWARLVPQEHLYEAADLRLPLGDEPALPPRGKDSVSFNRNTGRWDIPAPRMEEWRKQFASIDIDEALEEASAWLMEPRNHGRVRSYNLFVLKWLKRQAADAASAAGPRRDMKPSLF